MRYKEDSSGRPRNLRLNQIEFERFVPHLSKLTGLYANMFMYIVKILYQGLMYDIVNKSLDGEIQDELCIEIPHIGGLYLKYVDGQIEFDKFELENEFKEDIINSIENKTCELDDIIEKEYLNKILSKYEEVL